MKTNLDIDQIIDQLDIAVKDYPMKALAPAIGKRYKTLANKFSDQPGYKLGLVTALQILEVTANLAALDMIEEGFGWVAFDVPKPERNNMAPVMHLVAKLSEEFGESIEEMATALQDGVISKAEAQRCLKENKDLIKACLQLQGYLEQFLKIKEI